MDRFEEGRLKPDYNDPDNAPATQMVNWVWKLYQSDGVTPVMHEGNQVEYVAETSDSTHDKMSTAAKWFTAHRKIPFTRADKVDDVMADCLGKKVMLVITDKTSGYKKTDVFQSGV